MTEYIRNALRITTADFDDEIDEVVANCLTELELAGAVKVTEDSEIFARCAVLYAKAHFGYLDDSEKYQRAFERLRDTLAVSAEYGSVDEDGDDG